MRYELMIIVDPVRGRAEENAVKDEMSALVEKCGGTNFEFENYGERKLAYNIKKYKRGFFFLIHFDLEGSQVSQLKKELRLQESVIRFMLFKDLDAGLERRDLAKPVRFNIDSLSSQARFEKSYGSGRDSYESEKRAKREDNMVEKEGDRELASQVPADELKS